MGISVFGKFILTGSSTPADKTEVHNSGAGRITPVKMRPMWLFLYAEVAYFCAFWQGDCLRNYEKLLQQQFTRLI
jgi:hypothetical protein